MSEGTQQSPGPTKKCQKCGEDIQASAKKCKFCQSDLRNWFVRHKIVTGLLVIIVIIIIGSAGGNKNQSSSQTKNTGSKNDSGQSNSQAAASSNNNSDQTAQTPAAPAERQVEGKVTTLSTGNFTGGKDVPNGLYDVTTVKGQSGNFIVLGTDSYNEILGINSIMGVPKVRVRISDGDQIEISSLSKVIFTPVTTPFITDYAPVTLYAGTFTVGQDIAPGRYAATTTTGSSGNFIVSGNDNVNEILGAKEGMGVPSVTTNLTDGDVISISSLNQVTMTPAK